jgi:hypothetical protein
MQMMPASANSFATSPKIMKIMEFEIIIKDIG